MEATMVVVFILGYLAIATEHFIKINKAASAILTGVVCWTLYVFSKEDKHEVTHLLTEHLGDISGILFFLLGAMTIVELIDAHDGFQIITDQIKTRKKSYLLWITGLLAFFLSALLDNLTTTIVLVSLLRKIISRAEDRLFFTGIVVVAANAGGAWSPIGDVTSTMLWIGGQVSALKLMETLFVPSLICLLVPLFVVSLKMKGNFEQADVYKQPSDTTDRQRKAVFFIGTGSLIFVPVFKTVTHLPPFMGMLFALGAMWVLTELIHHKKDDEDKNALSVLYALRKIDTPSILFFLGILISISALQAAGLLGSLAQWLDHTLGNSSLIVVCIGLMSSIVDNVPLVAAVQGMYGMAQFPADADFWHFLAYAAGTGGSCLIIGSAAGVAAMGMEKIEFFWYIKRIAWLALLGFLAGALVFILQSSFN